MASKTALVLIADGSEEMEAVISINVLRRANVKVTVALVSGTNGMATCSREVKVVADVSLQEALTAGSYDAVVLPGGLNGAKTFAADPTVKELCQKQLSSGKILALICASPALVLPSAGIASGRKVTCYPALHPQLGDAYTYVDDKPVVVDGNLVTSQGPGTAFEFGLSVAQELVGAEAAGQVRKAMLL